MRKPHSQLVPHFLTLNNRGTQRSQLGRSKLVLFLITSLLAAGAAGGAWWWKFRADPSTDKTTTAAAAGSGGPGGPGSAGGGGAGRRGAMGGNRTQPVSVQVVKQQDLRVMVNAIGNVVALNTAVVRTKADGELKSVKFTEGQMVQAGQLLAEIDPRNYEAALQQATATQARDQAQLVNAQVDLKRYRDLLAKDSIASQQVDTQDALVKQLQATVRSDQSALDNAKLMLSYTKVVAPINGRLGLRQVDVGNVVHAGDANGLVTINQSQPIGAVFAVPEANLQRINRKLKGGNTLMVEAWDREQRNRLASGRVIATDNSVDTTTGTLKLKASLPNPEGSLFPNQFVNIRMQVDAVPKAITVPSNAVQRGSQGTFVYVVKDDSTVSMRKVSLGVSENDWVAVQGEVLAGDKVVTDGADRLRDGAKVEVIVPRGAGGAGAYGGARGARGGASAAGTPAGAGSGAGRPGNASANGAGGNNVGIGAAAGAAVGAMVGTPKTAAPGADPGKSAAPGKQGAEAHSPTADGKPQERKPADGAVVSGNRVGDGSSGHASSNAMANAPGKAASSATAAPGGHRRDRGNRSGSGERPVSSDAPAGAGNNVNGSANDSPGNSPSGTSNAPSDGAPKDSARGKAWQGGAGGRGGGSNGGGSSNGGSNGNSPTGAAAQAGGGDQGNWMDRLPPEVAERVKGVMDKLPPETRNKVNAMSTEERRAFFKKLREQREQAQ